MDTIAHTTHVQQAVDIVRSGTVAAGLVFDKSKLKRTRIRVVWLSPNDWYYGFRYGSVQFHFDVAELIAGMKAYYVETAEYNTRAPRILLTDRDSCNVLTPYDSRKRYGPWWHDDKRRKHYFNGNHTLELMMESDLSLMDASKITFVKHHNDFCSCHPKSPAHCKELGFQADRAGSFFIARLVGEKLASKVAALLTESSGPSASFKDAWMRLDAQLSRLASEFAGKMKAHHTSAPALTRAILRAYGARDTKDVKALAAMFKSRDELMRSVQTSVEGAFKLPDGALSGS